MFGRIIKSAVFAAGVAFSMSAASAASAADTIRIGVIEPLSGPIASVGADQLEVIQFVADEINANGGVIGKKFEIIPLDNAMNAEKTTQQLRKAIDQGIRYVTQGVGSNHALNIIKQLGKHNKRNPDQAVLYLNSAAITTAFTNELCSFWHFRFDANVDMKVGALLSAMGRDDIVKNVYMINQNYAYGKSFQDAANRMSKSRMPNGKIVGDDLIVPFGKVQDFTPIIGKIKASGADTVLTGNWGPDLDRLVKAAFGAGLNVQFYTIYGGIPSSIASYGKEAGLALRVKLVSPIHENHPQAKESAEFAKRVREKTQISWTTSNVRWVITLLAKAIEKAGTDDPKAVAYAMEGLDLDGPLGKVVMRKDDHQLQADLLVSELTDQYETELIYKGKGFGVAFKTTAEISVDEATQSTTCIMKRP